MSNSKYYDVTSIKLEEGDVFVSSKITREEFIEQQQQNEEEIASLSQYDGFKSYVASKSKK